LEAMLEAGRREGEGRPKNEKEKNTTKKQDRQQAKNNRPTAFVLYALCGVLNRFSPREVQKQQKSFYMIPKAISEAFYKKNDQNPNCFRAISPLFVLALWYFLSCQEGFKIIGPKKCDLVTKTTDRPTDRPTSIVFFGGGAPWKAAPRPPSPPTAHPAL
jgi:hypothetical protein